MSPDNLIIAAKGRVIRVWTKQLAFVEQLSHLCKVTDYRRKTEDTRNTVLKVKHDAPFQLSASTQCQKDTDPV